MLTLSVLRLHIIQAAFKDITLLIYISPLCIIGWKLLILMISFRDLSYGIRHWYIIDNGCISVRKTVLLIFPQKLTLEQFICWVKVPKKNTIKDKPTSSFMYCKSYIFCLPYWQIMQILHEDGFLYLIANSPCQFGWKNCCFFHLW